MEFNDKLAQARANNISTMNVARLRSDIAINDALRRESIKSLTTKLEDIYEDLNLDLDELARKIAVTRRSEYGRVPALLNILASTYAFPVKDRTEASNIPQYQEQIAELLHIDGEILLDLKESKGYHSFINDDFETVDGVEPDYEEYNYYILTIAEALQIPFVDSKITPTLWKKHQDTALAKIALEQEEAQSALARHAELLAS